MISGWTLVVWILLAMGSGIGYLASMVVAAITGRRIANSLSTVETEPKEVAVVAAHGLWSAALQLASAICRHYWPIALIAALLSRRCRQVVLVAAVVDGVVDWITRNGNADDDTKRVGLLSYVLLKRLDDIAYGIGLWTGVVRERHVGRPQTADPDLKRALHSDVLIVGAGSAGSVLAERLSADPRCRVTVVEAGPGPSDPRVRAQISDGLRLPIGTASSVVRRYPTTLTDDPKRQAQIMRGAVVGGSGAVNGGYFCRGLPGDFDGWGLPGWTWDDVLPHFRAIESDLDFDTPLHGSDGPILVRRVSEFDGCTASFVRSVGEAGYRWIDDLNGATHEEPLPTGVGAVPLNINGGTRVGPGGAYLQPAMDRTNLTLLTNTRVGRVRLRDGRAVGVECIGPDGALDLTADRIVLSAGAIGSAQLLMLSGRRPPGGAAGSGSACGGQPAGRRGVCGPSGMGAAGELVGNPRATAAGGGAYHQTP